MRMLLGILVVLLGGLNASAQKRATLGLDLAESFRSGNIKIMGGYGFCERWSVRYETAISTSPIRGEKNPEFEIHDGEFITAEEAEIPILTTGISVQYWPVQTYLGLYSEIGCRYGVRDMPCCMAGIGYCIPIWKGLSAILSYSMDIGTTAKEMKTGKECIAMEICWTFGKL